MTQRRSFLLALGLAASALASAQAHAAGPLAVANRQERDPRALALYEEAFPLIHENSDLSRFEPAAAEGLALAERAASLDPGFAEAWELVMRAYLNKGSVALQAARGRDKSGGSCVGGVFSAARTADIPEFDRAHEAAAKAHLARPEDPDLHMAYAYTAGVSGAPMAAGGRDAWAREMKQILARSPGYVPALSGYAEALDDLGRPDEAAAAWEAVLRRADSPDLKARAAAKVVAHYEKNGDASNAAKAREAATSGARANGGPAR